MNIRIKISVAALLLSGLVCFSIVRASVPPPVDEGMLRFISYGIVYILILLGPLSALTIANATTGPLVGTFLLVGLVCTIAYFKILHNKKVKMSFIIIPIIVWCVLGGFGTYWGLLAAI